MSDDLTKKIKQITELLTQENMPDNLKGLFSLLTGPGGKDESQSKSGESSTVREDSQNKDDLDDSMDMVRKIKKVMDRLNTRNDPRVNLLSAIRPYLNNTRQKKLDNCIKLLQVTSLTKLLDDNEKNGH